MPQRSQRHKDEFQPLLGPPITNILPDTATIAAVGAVGRTVATLSIAGGTAPVTYVDGQPCRHVDRHHRRQFDHHHRQSVRHRRRQVRAGAGDDSRGQSKTETITVTVT